MGLENSPSLGEYERGLPPPPANRAAKRRRVWLGIGVIVGLIVGLAVVNLSRSDQAARWLGTGTIAGVVVDEQGKPVADAEVIVVRTDIVGRTDAQGSFEVRGVPAGARAVVIARDGGGREYAVVVTAGGTTQLGEIQFTGTRVPGQ